MGDSDVAELLITPQNADFWCGPENAKSVFWHGHKRALNATPPKQPYGLCAGVAAIEDVITLIPRSEWQDRIKEKDANDTWLKSICKDVKCKDQNGLGYCHAYGTVSPMEIAAVAQGEPYVELSAESIGGVVTDWRNAGADPEDDLAAARTNGACAASFMDKPNSITPSRWKAGWQADALRRRVLEHFDCGTPGKEFDAVVTCALLNFPVGLGYAWWSHFVHGVFRVRYNAQTKKYEIENRNSWDATYGDNGYFWLAEGTGRGQGTPDWAFGVRNVSGDW
jgi:hypothetical protein